jgi:hypothetical protein
MGWPPEFRANSRPFGAEKADWVEAIRFKRRTPCHLSQRRQQQFSL